MGSKKIFLGFKDARKAVRGMGLTGRDDYRYRRSQYKISELIPWNPIYEDWRGYSNWLGTK